MHLNIFSIVLLFCSVVFSGSVLIEKGGLGFSGNTSHNSKIFYLSDNTDMTALELLEKTKNVEKETGIDFSSVQKGALVIKALSEKFTERFAPALSNVLSANALSAEAVTNRIANASYKYIAIGSGMRREQVAGELGEELGWGDFEREAFVGNTHICPLKPVEGHLSAGTYLIDKKANPQDIRDTMIDNFRSSLLGLKEESVYSDNEIIIIASLIEREAGGEYDSKTISGIIWNRLQKDMKLDIDASLQYAKAKHPLWWPSVKPKDKFIDSPYNTYMNKGLPPTPIATPSLASIIAALNPQKTSCLFYFHDEGGKFYCSRTYSEHKQKIGWYLK